MAYQHRHAPMVHVFAGVAALLYAWGIFHTPFVTSGLQFVAPLFVIMMIHGIWLFATGHMVAGFSEVLFKRVAQTSLGLVVAAIVVQILAPEPAQADLGHGFDDLLAITTCLIILLVILSVAAFVLWLAFKALQAIWRYFLPPSSGPQNRLFDFASVGIALGLVVGGSLEGLTSFYNFSAHQTARVSYKIDATPDEVWQTMEQATSPEFPLPDMLRLFPQPTEVSIDEGTRLGAKRQVQFNGREGSGTLSLQVTKRNDTEVVFTVLSDTTPFSNWIAFQQLRYQIVPHDGGALLEVSLDFERRLAPAWFFQPVMRNAAKLAMGVLARDVKNRAEQMQTVARSSI